MENWNWKRIGIGIGIGAALTLHPLGRKIILFLLPLGKGWDDFVEIALIILFLIWFGSRVWIHWNKTKSFRHVDRNANRKVKQAVLVVLCIFAFFIIPTTGMALNNAILFGEYSKLSSPDFLIPAGIISAVLVIGWNLISYFDKRNRK